MASSTDENPLTYDQVFEFKHNGLCFTPPTGGGPQWRTPPEVLRLLLEDRPANYFRSQQILYGIVSPDKFSEPVDENSIKQDLLHCLRTGAYLEKLPAMAAIERKCIEASVKKNLKDDLNNFRPHLSVGTTKTTTSTLVDSYQQSGWACVNKKPQEASNTALMDQLNDQTTAPCSKMSLLKRPAVNGVQSGNQSESETKRGRAPYRQPTIERTSSSSCLQP